MSSEHTGGGASKAKQKWNNRSKPMAVSRPLRSPTNSDGNNNDNQQLLKVSLSSISKVEVRNLKRKFRAELDEVRSLIKRLDTTPVVNNVAIAKTVVGSNKKMKPGVKKGPGDKGLVQIFKNCNNLLTKLMKHKVAWVFNVPVNAKELGLHDYHTIVKEPMDLGTVKSKLGKGLYQSPLEFAEDVRLTFSNAILYNPVEHEVHHWAKLLSGIFEEKWVAIEVQFDNLHRKLKPTRDIEFPRPVPAVAPTIAPVVEPLRAPTPSPSPPPVVENKTVERAESLTTPVEPEPEHEPEPEPEHEPEPEPEPVAIAPEQPEEEEVPVIMRDLTLEEKQRLSEELQDLPYDRLDIVVQIIKKRNPELSQQEEEIELDIDSVDIETLWELYRFVIGYKESLSKKKEDQGFGSERDAESVHNTIQEPTTLVPGTKTSRVPESGKAIRAPSPGRRGSSSSNSSSSGDTGSGSSDSDSDSSSGRESDTGN